MEASAGGRASDRGCIGRRARRIPLDGAEVFQPREIASISNRVALAEDPGDFPRLPGDDARQIRLRQRKAFTCSHSSRALMNS
jgi:hypothetical protein